MVDFQELTEDLRDLPRIQRMVQYLATWVAGSMTADAGSKVQRDLRRPALLM
jgi:hypothetical protein